MEQCKWCAAITEDSENCGRCAAWPRDYDPTNPTIGDLGRVAKVAWEEKNQWTTVVTAILDATKAAGLEMSEH